MKQIISEAIAHSITGNRTLADCPFRMGSESYMEYYREARRLYREGKLPHLDWESRELLETNIGETVKLKGLGVVPLDMPIMEADFNPADQVVMNVPLLLRLMEYSKEQAQTDMDLHEVLEHIIQLSGTGETLTMDHYDDIIHGLPSEDTVNEGLADKLNRFLNRLFPDKNYRMAIQLYLKLEQENPGHQLAHIAKAAEIVNGVDGNKLARMIDLMTKVGLLGTEYSTGPRMPVTEAEYQGRDVELNKPKRGGSKKFYVYVRNPSTGKVKKVSFGASGGGQNLSVKLQDPQARKAFADRHNCDQKNDKTKPGYWSCRLPRWAKQLGLKGSGQWW